MQSNHFSLPGISVKASVARIPWVRSSFTGFIAGVWLHDKLIRFTTYNKSSLLKLEILLTDRRSGKIVLNDTGYNTGLEVAGKISEIVKSVTAATVVSV